MENQTVIVYPTTATYDEVLERIKKTGKEVCMHFLIAAVALLCVIGRFARARPLTTKQTTKQTIRLQMVPLFLLSLPPFNINKILKIYCDGVIIFLAMPCSCLQYDDL